MAIIFSFQIKYFIQRGFSVIGMFVNSIFSSPAVQNQRQPVPDANAHQNANPAVPNNNGFHNFNFGNIPPSEENITSLMVT